MSVLEWFCDVDDFMLSFAPQWKASELAAGKQRQRSGQMWPSEFMRCKVDRERGAVAGPFLSIPFRTGRYEERLV